MIERRYEFHWGLIGDVELGRPNLGHTTSVEMYRLMHHALRDTIEMQFDHSLADQIFYKAGKIAGEAFFDHYVIPTGDLNEYIKQLQDLFRKFGIGILHFERIDIDNTFIVTISEDLECSGLNRMDFEICKYDEGFVSGLLQRFSGDIYEVEEIDCWCTGDRTCRFKARKVQR